MAKTTTTTMLAWILHYAGIDTGFLIGGVPLVDTTDNTYSKCLRTVAIWVLIKVMITNLAIL